MKDDALLLGSVTIPGQPEHLRAARSFMALALGDHHADADTVVLLISEMVTNSIQHSNSGRDGGTITITLFAMPGGIRAEITDQGGLTVPTLQPSPRESADPAESGRGLRLADTLSTGWGHYRDEASAVTWFELATPPGTVSQAGLPSADTGRAFPPRTTVLDGTRLRRLRHQRGLSQETLASDAGISLTTVARLERRRCSPCRCRTLVRLAAALGEHPAAIAPDVSLP